MATTIVYYVNQFTGLRVGIIGGMQAGVVYAPAVNLPQTEDEEHYVRVPGGEDGRDGKMFDVRFWSEVETRTLI